MVGRHHTLRAAAGRATGIQDPGREELSTGCPTGNSDFADPDWGSMITELLAGDHASEVLGIHLTDVPCVRAYQTAQRSQPRAEELPRGDRGSSAAPVPRANGPSASSMCSAGRKCRVAGTSRRSRSRRRSPRTSARSSGRCVRGSPSAKRQNAGSHSRSSRRDSRHTVPRPARYWITQARLNSLTQPRFQLRRFRV